MGWASFFVLRDAPEGFRRDSAGNDTASVSVVLSVLFKLRMILPTEAKYAAVVGAKVFSKVRGVSFVAGIDGCRWHLATMVASLRPGKGHARFLAAVMRQLPCH